MREYEFIFILKPKLKESEQKKKIAQIEKLVADLDGKVKKKEVWGKKDLAYPIAKYKQGIYVQFNFSLPEKNVKAWEEKIKLEEEILRYLLIKTED
jgi:small subunit ribosomal protein S6